MSKLKWYKVFDTWEEACEKIPQKTAVALQAGEKRICLARTHDKFYAVDDACPHLGAPLSRGKINNENEIVCPWHNYRYHLLYGRECSERSEDVEVHKVEMRKGGFYVGIYE